MKAQLKDFYGNYANEEETAEEIAEVCTKKQVMLWTHIPQLLPAVYRKYVAETR